MAAADADSGASERAVPPLLLAKTRVPTPAPILVRRDRLIGRLCDSRDRQVTLVQAPAGYGKSTLLVQWARADPIRRFGWLTLENTENDPRILWRYMLLALQTLTPRFAEKAQGLMHRDVDAVITHVLNGLLDVPGRLVLVLDDYHVITNPECHRSIQYFIDHLPRSTQVAFGTRARPPLSLSKLEASGVALTMDAGALQFTLEETRKTFEGVGRRLSPDQVLRVHERTEGWPVGVYLAATADDVDSLATQESVGVDVVHTYLLEQMLEQFSADQRSALVTWSILRHLHGDLCDRAAGRNGSATYLASLRESNLLLTSLDGAHGWYRLHDLLRGELRQEFDRRPTEQQQAAHLRAMDWWLENGDTLEAIGHAIEADQHERAAELICANWLDYMLSGQLATLRHWIDQLAADALVAYPPVLVAAAWIAAFSGDVGATHRFAAAAGGASFDHQMPDGSASYLSAVAILGAGLGLDGMADANEHAELAYHLEPVGSPWRPLAAALAGLTRYGLGRYEEARVALSEAARERTGPDGVATYARGQLALLAMSESDWAEGSRQADLACAMIEEAHLGDLLSSGAARVAAAAAAAHAGQHGLARERLRALASIQAVLSDAIPFDAFQIHLVAAEAYLALGDHRAADVHARTASTRLRSFGDGGVFEQRLTELENALARYGEAAADAVSERERLTDRELQILAMLPSDLSLRDISSDLYVSRNTAKTHVASVYRKLGVTNRTAAIARARQLDLI